MKKHQMLVSALQLCSVIIDRVAVELNGGNPLPKRQAPSLATLLGQAPKAAGVVRAQRKGCAIIDCGKPNRTKGYCAAHYQKLRLLEKTRRRPFTWADYAGPGTVKDIALPRGRAGSKALAEARGEE